MLDIKLLRSDPEQVAQALRIKGYHFDVAGFISLDEQILISLNYKRLKDILVKLKL